MGHEPLRPNSVEARRDGVSAAGARAGSEDQAVVLAGGYEAAPLQVCSSNHLNGQRRTDMSAQVRARVEWWLTARLAPDLYGGRARCVSHGPMRVQDCVVAGDGRRGRNAARSSP